MYVYSMTKEEREKSAKKVFNDIVIEHLNELGCDDVLNAKIIYDRDYVKELVSIDGMLLGKIQSKYKSDKEIIFLSVKQNKEAIQFMDKRLLKDYEFMFQLADKEVLHYEL